VKDETLASMGQIVWRLIERHDLAPEPLFRAAGIDPQLIHDPHARIPRPNGDALMRALAERIADPAFGLQAAQCWHPSNLGTLGYAWLASSTLRTGLKRLVRYWRVVIADVTVRLDETPEGAEFLHVPPELDSTLDRIRGDIVMAIIYDMCRINFGHAFRPRRVAFRHPAPADTSPYEALFGCPVSFGADANRLLIGRAEAWIDVAILVVVLAFLGVAEDFEGALDFLKLGLGFRAGTSRSRYLIIADATSMPAPLRRASSVGT
jgi:hypothetical protein